VNLSKTVAMAWGTWACPSPTPTPRPPACRRPRRFLRLAGEGDLPQAGTMATTPNRRRRRELRVGVGEGECSPRDHDLDPANGGTDSAKELTDLNLGGCRRPQMGGANDLSFQD